MPSQESSFKMHFPGCLEQCAKGPSCPVRGLAGLTAVLKQRELLRGLSVVVV